MAQEAPNAVSRSEEQSPAAAPPSAAVETAAVAAPPRASAPVVILCVLAVLAAMYVARDLLIPVVFAILLALLLRPIQRRMRRLRIPDFVSALVLIVPVAALFLVGTLMLASQAQRWLVDAPGMVAKVSRMLPAGPGPFEHLERTTAAVEELARADKQEPVEVKVQSNDVAYTVLGVSSHFVAVTVIVFVVGYFVLALSDTLMRQTVSTQPSFFEKRNVVQLVQNVEYGVSRYLLTITVINAALGGVTALAMWLLGIPNPLLWGVMAGTLNFVPHVGAFICLVVLFFVGTVTHESIGYGLLVASVFVALTSAESYFITPMVLSRSLQLSPLAVLLAILFWGWLWGIPGGLMAAPLLTVIKVVCDQFQSLHGVAAVLSGEPPAAGAAAAANQTASRSAEPAPTPAPRPAGSAGPA